jgi:hypothetical protein
MGHGGRALGVAGAHPDALFHQARLVLAQVVLKLLQPLARALVLGLHPRVVTRARSRRVGRHRNQLEVQGSVGGLAHLVDGRSQHVGLERAVLTGDEGHPLEAGEALVVADVGLDIKVTVARWGRHLRWRGSRSAHKAYERTVHPSGPALTLRVQVRGGRAQATPPSARAVRTRPKGSLGCSRGSDWSGAQRDVRCISPVSGLVQLSATTFSWGVTSCARRFHHAAALPLGGLPCYGPCSCGSRLFTLARSTRTHGTPNHFHLC